MIDLAQVRAVLVRAVSDADHGELTDLIGAIEAAKAAAWSKLTTSTAPTTAPSSDVNLTAEEVADRLNVPSSFVYELARQNRIPVRRLGRYRRFDLAAVEAALDAEGGTNTKRVTLGTARKSYSGKGSGSPATRRLPSTPAENPRATDAN